MGYVHRSAAEPGTVVEVSSAPATVARLRSAVEARMKIYTKTGDGGETGLVDGSRVRKDHARVAAFGDVDELNAVVGVARAHAGDELSQLLEGVQRDLFAIGAQVADPGAQVASRKEKAALAAERSSPSSAPSTRARPRCRR